MSRMGNFFFWFCVVLGGICILAAIASTIGMIAQNQATAWEALKMTTFPFVIGLACVWTGYFFKKRLARQEGNRKAGASP